MNQPFRLPRVLVTTMMTAAAFATACSEKEEVPASADAGATDSGFVASNLCPDAKNPRVHYVDRDANKCRGVELACTTEQNGFSNTCGCGCIDKGDPLCPPLEDPAIEWVSHDPAACGTAPPLCDKTKTPFSNSCGCGCVMPGG